MYGFHVRDDFRAGAPLSQVPASWLNAVASFINGLIGGFGIRIESIGRAITVSADVEVLKNEVLKAFAPVEVDSLASGGNPQPVMGSVDDKTFTAEGPLGRGAEIYIATRSEEYGELGAIIYRKFTIGSDGRIYAISGEDASKTQIVYTNGGAGT